MLVGPVQEWSFSSFGPAWLHPSRMPVAAMSTLTTTSLGICAAMSRIVACVFAFSSCHVTAGTSFFG